MRSGRTTIGSMQRAAAIDALNEGLGKFKDERTLTQVYLEESLYYKERYISPHFPPRAWVYEE